MTRPIRAVLVFSLLALGLFRVLVVGVQSGWLYVAAAALFALGFFPHGPVRLAYLALLRGDASRAASLLSRISDPSRLSRQDISYYHWVKGNLALAASRHAEAYQHLVLAASGNLRTNHIRAATECALAESALGLGDISLARSHFVRAGLLPHRATLAPVLASLAERLGPA